MKTILIVEDEKEIRQSIAEILNFYGYKTIETSNGKEALDIASNKKETIDLVICDILMPEMDGYAFLKEFRKIPHCKALPFIFLTAMSSRANLRKGMEYGADDYIPKPFTEEELINAINIRFEKIKAIAEFLEAKSESEFQEQKNNIVSSKEENQQDKKSKILEYESRIILSVDGKPKFVKLPELILISAARDYTELKVKNERKFLVKKTMKDWEEILPENYFIRIHRSYIINVEYIDRIEKWFNQAYKVYLKEIQEPFVISRRYGKKLKEKFI